MTRHLHTESVIMQARHRVLCNIITNTKEGQSLIERARRLGFPVDWDDARVYPNRPGYSDFGATFMLAKDVLRAELTREIRLRGGEIDRTSLEASSSRQAQLEATNIFNALRSRQIELSGYVDGRYVTCQQMPWQRRSPAAAPASVPPRSEQH